MTNQDVFIIAEVGSVHDGSFGNALKLVELAHSVGADAVKFQTHIAEAETLRDAPMPPYFEGEPRYEYFERTGFSSEQWNKIKTHCFDLGIEFMSSPFSIEAVNLLEEVGLSRYKIPSGEVTNLPLIEAVARTGKPILMSSGMSSWTELDAAVSTVRTHHERLQLMQCVSSYPCPDEQVGLNVIAEMSERWGLPVGYSDHTLDNYACFAAVSQGAVVIEKHLTFSRAMYGSDALHSAEPPQFRDLVKGIRAISRMLASRVKKEEAVGNLQAMKEIFEKSIVTIADVSAGEKFSLTNISVKKPGTGIPAARLNEIIGRTAKVAIPKDRLIAEDDIS